MNQMSQKTRFYSNVNRNSIINKADYLGYKGGVIEQFAAAIIVRPVFSLVYLLTITASLILFLFGFALIACLLLIFVSAFRFQSIRDTENIDFIDKASPILEMIWPKKWKAKYGDMFIGTEERTGKQLWKSSSDFLYHSYIIGASGSGKTVFLNSVFFMNYLCMGSGIFFMDFKGTTELPLQYLSSLHRFGRANCFKLLNFGNPKEMGSVIKNSHSTSSFLQNDPYPSYMFLDPFIAPEGGGGDNKYFVDNAVQHLKAVLQALHDMQKKRYFRITPSLIAKYAKLNDFLGLYHDDRISKNVKEMYLVEIYEQFNLNYKEKKGKQTEEAVRMYTIFLGTYMPSLRFFGDNFGQIYESMVSEFDVVSLVNNRQVGVASLATASKGQSDVSSLAMAILNQLRVALGANLGGDFHGNRIDVANVARTADDVPFLFAADEYFIGLKAEGTLGLQAAQGRGAGLALAAASQDTTALDQTNELEHAQVLGSTQNKYLMCLKDAKNTMDLVERLIPEEDVIKRSTTDSEWNNYTVNSKTSVETIKVEKATDLVDNEIYPPGTMLAIGPGHACKIRCFYYKADEFLLNSFRLSCSLPSVPPNQTVLKKEISLRDMSLKIGDSISQAQEVLSSQLVGENADDVKALAFGLAGDSWPFIVTGSIDYKKVSEEQDLGDDNSSNDDVDVGQLANVRLSRSSVDMFSAFLEANAPMAGSSTSNDESEPELVEDGSSSEEVSVEFNTTQETDDFDSYDMDQEQESGSAIESQESEGEVKIDQETTTHSQNDSVSDIHSDSDTSASPSSYSEQPPHQNASKTDSERLSDLDKKLSQLDQRADDAATVIADKAHLFIDAEIQINQEAYKATASKFGSSADVWSATMISGYDVEAVLEEMKFDQNELSDLVDSVS